MVQFVIRFLLLVLLAATFPLVVSSQEHSDVFDFWLSEAFVKELAEKDTLFFPMELNMEHRTSKVHTLANDCEIHIAASPDNAFAWPSSVVVEPPNTCKERAPGMPNSSETKLRNTLWPNYLDDNVMNRKCTVIGFPRIFTEHAAGAALPANPNHVLEVHPALEFKCGNDFVLDMRPFLKTYLGMRSIKPESAENCLTTRKLFVRLNDEDHRYEFIQEGGPKCGNFVVFQAVINPDWIREPFQDAGGGHSAIARGYFGCFENFDCLGPYTLKIYTYPGTPEDALIAGIKNGTENSEEFHYIHGMITYDYFAIIKTVRDRNRVWLLPDQLEDWTEVKFPLTLVVFGKIEP